MHESWNACSGSEISARRSAARSPKRRYSVPLPTPAAAATSSIEKWSIPTSWTSRAAAHRMRSRLRRASARSRSAGAGPDIGSSNWGTTCSTLNRLGVPGSHPCGQHAEELLEGVAQIGLDEVAVAAEGAAGLADRQLAVEDVGAGDAEDLLDVRLGPDGAEQAGGGADDGDRLALQRAVGEGAGGPVQRVLEHAGDGAVELGRGDEDAVGVGDGLAQAGHGRVLGLDVEIGVVVREGPEGGGERQLS